MLVFVFKKLKEKYLSLLELIHFIGMAAKKICQKNLEFVSIEYTFCIESVPKLDDSW